MSKFYCNICDEEVTLNNGKCPKCKTNWGKINEVSYQEEQEDGAILFQSKITDDDIDNNIFFFLKWASIGKIFMFIMATIVVLISFAELDDTDGKSLLLIIAAVVIIFYALVFENNLKWKAYMLHTNRKNKK